MTGISNHGELKQKLKQLQYGDHLCCIYETEEEHRVVLTPFMSQGLKVNDRVIYIVDTRSADDFLNYLRDDGVAVESRLDSGQLVILTADEAYLSNGHFDPDAMITLLRTETDRTLEEGYSGLRVTSEMSWTLRKLPGTDRIIEYDSKLNEFFPGSKCLAICQYDRRRFEPSILLDVLSTHPIAIVGTTVFDNFYYIPPRDFLGPDPTETKYNSWIHSLAERKRIEDSLRDSETSFRTAIESLPFDFFKIDNSGTYVMQNSTCREHWGDLRGRRPEDIVADQDILTLFENNNRRAFNGETVKGEVSFGSHGNKGCFYNIISPIYVDDKIQGILGVNIDITHPKKAERELAETKDHLNNVIESSLDSIVVCDPSGYITRINRAFLELCDYTREEILGKHASELSITETGSYELTTGEVVTVGEEYYKTHKEMIPKLLKGTAIKAKESYFRRQDGKVIVCEQSISSLYNQSGEVIGAVAIVRDISDRNHSEKALRISEAKYRSLVESSSDHIFMLSPDGTYLASNNQIQHIKLKNSQQLVNQTIWDIYPNELAQFYQEQINKVITNNQTVNFEHPIISGESLKYHQDTLYPIKQDGKIWAVGGVCRDITDRLLAEEQLKSSRESLRELAWHVESVLEEERSRIARQIHDDLGQILTGLKMDLSWLEKKISRNEEPIADKLVQMSQLIDETILLVQKISTELRPSLLDNLGLGAAVEWQANDFQKRTGTIVDLVLGADEMDIDRDSSTALFRIFQEALTNIVRHSKATKVRVSLDEQEEQIVLAIKDNGIGISQEEISNPHSLGLIGMNERVHFLGGTFEIAGRPGEGTTLTVTIPHSADGTRQ